LVEKLALGLHFESLFHANPVQEGIIAIIMFIYVLGIVYGTKYTYNLFRSRGLPHNVSAYYNRKLIHIFAGGVITLLFPIFFTAVTIPLILVSVIALITYLPHRTGKLLYWFQVKENMYEVNFVIAWGIAIGLAWFLFGDPIYGVIPAAFMSFGDAITGIVRNTIFKRRTKHWIGNIAMVLVCTPIGYYYAGIAGIMAAFVASIAERFEFNPIDDNILITFTSLITLILLRGI
jgi:phytol kinase